MASHIVDEFITFLGFRTDLKPAEAFKKVMTDLTEVGKRLAVTMTGMAAGITAFTENVAHTVEENANFTASLGTTNEALEKYIYAIENVGGSADSARGDFQTLAEVARKTGRTFEQTAEDYATIFSHMGKNEAYVLGKNMGLSADAVRLSVEKGKKGLIELFDLAKSSGSVLPENSVETAKEFNLQMKNIGQVINGVYKNAVMGALPEVTKLLEKVKDFIYRNRELIQVKVKEFIEGFTKGFREAVDVLKDVYEAVKPVIEKMFGLTDSMTGVDKWATIIKYSMLTLAVIMGVKMVAGVVGFAVELVNLVKTIKTAIIATKAWTVAQLSNPIILIAAAVAILIAVIAELSTEYANSTGVGMTFFDSLMAIGLGINTFLLSPVNLLIDGLIGLADMFSFLPGSMGKSLEEASKSMKKFQVDMNKTYAGIDINKESKYNMGGAWNAAYERQVDKQGGIKYYGKGGKAIDREKEGYNVGATENKVEEQQDITARYKKILDKFNMPNQEGIESMRQVAPATNTTNNINKSQNTLNINITGVQDNAKIIQSIKNESNNFFQAITPGSRQPATS